MPELRLCPYGFQICRRESGCTPFPHGFVSVGRAATRELVDNCPDLLVKVHPAAYQLGPPRIRGLRNCDHCDRPLTRSRDADARIRTCPTCGCQWEASAPHQLARAGSLASCRPKAPTQRTTKAVPAQ